MTAEPETTPEKESAETLRIVVETLLLELRNGAGDRDKRRPVEEWMKSLAEKYPEFSIENGLREYYLAEAERLRVDFDKAPDLTEKLNLGRTIELFLDKASEIARRKMKATPPAPKA